MVRLIARVGDQFWDFGDLSCSVAPKQACKRIAKKSRIGRLELSTCVHCGEEFVAFSRTLGRPKSVCGRTCVKDRRRVAVSEAKIRANVAERASYWRWKKRLRKQFGGSMPDPEVFKLALKARELRRELRKLET